VWNRPRLGDAERSEDELFWRVTGAIGKNGLHCSLRLRSGERRSLKRQRRRRRKPRFVNTYAGIQSSFRSAHVAFAHASGSAVFRQVPWSATSKVACWGLSSLRLIDVRVISSRLARIWQGGGRALALARARLVRSPTVSISPTTRTVAGFAGIQMRLECDGAEFWRIQLRSAVGLAELFSSASLREIVVKISRSDAEAQRRRSSANTTARLTTADS
jgi:hypothetical protein